MFNDKSRGYTGTCLASAQIVLLKSRINCPTTARDFACLIVPMKVVFCKSNDTEFEKQPGYLLALPHLGEKNLQGQGKVRNFILRQGKFK